MKKIFTLISVLALAFSPLRATAPALTQGPEYAYTVWANPVWTNTLTAPAQSSFVLSAAYHSDIGSGPGLYATADTGQLNVDLIANASKTVSVGGQSYSYGTVLQLLTAVLAQERAAQLAAH